MSGMRFGAAVLGLAFLQRCGWIPCFFPKSKRTLAFCLMAGLLPALFIPNAVAQSSTNIPIFQFAVFYNLDLEINAGKAFTINGRVHSNTNIWATGTSSSERLTFLDSVDATGSVSNRSSPLDPRAPIRFGNVIYPPGSPIAHSGTLNLPLVAPATNYTYAAIESLLKMPPPAYALGTAAAYTTNGQRYFANLADLIITNDAATGTNITVLYQNQYKGSGPSWLFPVLPDAIGNIVTNIISIITNGTGPAKTYVTNYTYITNFYYSYVTNVTFYDYREGDTVKALQIDVSKLGAWLGNTNSTGGWQYELINTDTANGTSKGHVINSIFVYNSLPTNSSQLPAVRVVNGAQLPNISRGGYPASGLGIATAMPIYVKGHYNVTTNGVHFAYTLGSTTNGTLPAALLGDSITILSSNWNDAYTSGTALSSRSAVNTTINAACFQGIVPSDGTYYSGGLENFLRLLENWNGDTLTYNGSFVVMFPSVYATSHWGGSYYGVPTRQWGFDANFLNLSKLPPLTPWVVDNTTNSPVIATQPQSQIVASGNSAIFTVTALGPRPLAYLWSFKGTNVAGATNASFTLTNVQGSQAGNYAVLVTNAFGSVLSSNAVLTVVASSPTIQAQPTNQTVIVNDTATFNVTATGSLPLSYQWNFNGTNLDGATNASLTLTNVQFSQAGNYAVQVTNAFGSTSSSNAVLGVAVLSPAILAQPIKRIANQGETAIFSVTAIGSLPLSYQWNLSGTNLVGATNALLTLTNVQFCQAGNYTVQVTNAFGSIVSSNAVLTVNALVPVVIYVAEEQLLRVSLIYSDGSIHPFVNNLGLIYGLAADKVGNLYVANTSGDVIYKITPTGKASVYASGSALGAPHDMAFDNSGLLLYSPGSANGTISQISPNGNITLFASGISWPSALAFDANGNLYVANGTGNNIVKITPSGMATIFASGSSLNFPWGLAFDQDGNLFVANYNGNTVSKVTPDGAVSLFATGLNRPTGLAFDRNGYLYVCNGISGSGFVSKIDPYGAVTTFATGLNLPTAIVIQPASNFPAMTLNTFSLSASNGVQFQVAGVPGFNYAVQTSTNLIDWVPLLTNSSPFIFTDANATNSPQQFYRTLYVP
jgi:hypothetical protein